jgi:hypothetical protein
MSGLREKGSGEENDNRNPEERRGQPQVAEGESGSRSSGEDQSSAE